MFWSTIRENRFFLAQKYNMGDVGMLVRRVKRDVDPQGYRIITATEPLYEVLVAETEQAILFAMAELIEKQLMPRVFGLSHSRIMSLLPDLITALQASNPSKSLDEVMANYHDYHASKRKPSSPCSHCNTNNRNARFVPCGHQLICVVCTDTLSLSDNGLVCPACGLKIKKVITVEV